MHFCKSVLCFEKEKVCEENSFMEFAHLYLFKHMGHVYVISTVKPGIPIKIK